MTTFCPLTGDPCAEHQCEWYTHLVGADPSTGAQVDKWGCTITFLPMLLIENSLQQRQTGAAVESLRNEQTARQDKMISVAEERIKLMGEVS